MPLVMLIRHGETDYIKKRRLAGRLEGVHINKNGVKQAEKLAEKLASVPVKAIYSSPLERTMETAAPVAKAHDQEVVACAELIEIDCGEWQDQALGKLRRTKSWKLVQGSPSRFQFPGGETFATGQLRIATFLQTLTGMYEQKDIILCVSHADPIRLALAFLIGLPLDFFQRLSVAPASISALQIGQGDSRLLYLNLPISDPFPVK